MPFSLYRKGRKGDDTSPPDLFIAVLSSSGRPCINFVVAMVDTAVYLEDNGIKFDFWTHSEDCHVDDARNYLVAQFLKSGAPYMVFIDDDVGWDTVAFARMYCFKDADIIGGIYPLKQHTEDYPVRIKPTGAIQARPDGLLEVDGVPTGFMRISREVLVKMSEKRKHMFYLPKDGHPGDEKLQVIFERMMVDGRRWSGDLNFCREARLLGFKVWCDPEMSFSHMGNMRWEGNLGDHLRRKAKLLDPHLDLAIERLITGDTSAEVFNDIFKYNKNKFSAGPKMLHDIYQRCKEAKGPILECGSGISTLIAGIACQRNGQMVHALEHDMEWFRQMRHSIRLWKLKTIALYYAPLTEYKDMPGDALEQADPNHPMTWYGDTEELPAKFDVVILDGPPRRYGRSGLYRLHLDKIKDASVWIVDDTEDKGQMALLTKYAEECGKKVEDFGGPKGSDRHYAIAT